MTYLQKVENAKKLVQESLAKYPKIAVGCSFGKDSMVTLHLVRQFAPDVAVLSVMSDTEFPETYAFEQEVVRDWGLNLKKFTFKQEEGGLALCCGTPKVAATREAVGAYEAWFSGVRRDEGFTRTDFAPVEEQNGLTKINPVLEFTEHDIWRYIALNRVPFNPKYLEGYRSLGCARCSYPDEDQSQPERAGRWRGTVKVCGECGIHSYALREAGAAPR